MLAIGMDDPSATSTVGLAKGPPGRVRVPACTRNHTGGLNAGRDRLPRRYAPTNVRAFSHPCSSRSKTAASQNHTLHSRTIRC